MMVRVDESEKTIHHAHKGKGRVKSASFRIYHRQTVHLSGYLEGQTIRFIIQIAAPSGRASVNESTSGRTMWEHGWVKDGRKSVSADIDLRPGTYHIEIEGQNNNSGGELTLVYRERFESVQTSPGAPWIPVGPTDKEPGIYKEGETDEPGIGAPPGSPRQGVPVWVWFAGGGLILVGLMRRRKSAA